jgi:hypothetical protein
MFTPGINPWISVNPLSAGRLPTDVGALTSDDIDNGQLGKWYYYDPVTTTLDLTANSGNWITQTKTGIEIWADLSKASTSGSLGSELQFDHAKTEGGRVATALMKPDGSGQFTFGDLVGGSVEFLVYAGENSPHDDNEECGLVVGIAGKDIMDHTGGATEAEAYGVSCTYKSATAGSTDIQGDIFSPSHSGNFTGTGLKKIHALFYFSKYTDTEVTCGHFTGRPFDADDEVGNVSAGSKQSAERPAMSAKVYLFVGVCAIGDNSSASGTLRSGAFKIFYRLNWTSEYVSPDYVAGGNNINTGTSDGWHD